MTSQTNRFPKRSSKSVRHELRDVQNRPILGRGQGGVTGYDSLFLEGRSRSSIIDEENAKNWFCPKFNLRIKT